jgi:hypothetical protein
MLNTAGCIILLFLNIRISVYDFKTHYIKNMDLILLFLAIIIFLDFNLIWGFANLAIYLTLYFLTNRQLGLGDVKLSFFIGLVFLSLYDLVIALNISWISGGVWAIIRKESQIAFAPWMLVGAFITQIMVN